MPVTAPVPPQPAPFPSSSVGADVWAGAATAVIFYIEYLGLGSLLGEALRPGLPDGPALGTLLVIVPVVVCSLFALASHGAALAGPRAASLVVVAKLLLVLAAAYPVAQGGRTLLLAVITATAALTLLFGRLAAVQRAIDRAPVWLIQGFMFATALGIVAGGAAAGRVLGCLQVDTWATWTVYLPPVILGLVWKPVFQRLHDLVEQRRGPAGWMYVLKRLTPLGLLAGALASWWFYEHTRLALPNGPWCGRFGDLRVDWSLLDARWSSIVHPVELPPLGAWLGAAAGGVAVGAVLLLESLTAFAVNGRLTAYARVQPRMLCAAAAGGLLSAAAGGAPASFSTSRTVVLRLLGGRGRWAVPVHGLALLAIVLFATPWLAQVPRLSAAVALTLVGAQMLGRDTERLWEHGYRPGARPALQSAIVGFWMVLGVSLAINNALVGFLVMAVAAGVLYPLRRWARRRARAMAS